MVFELGVLFGDELHFVFVLKFDGERHLFNLFDLGTVFALQTLLQVLQL